MYAKIENGQVVQYPYTTAELRRDNPDSSLPADPIPNSVLSEFGVVSVAAAGWAPYDQRTQRIEQRTPINQNGQWVQNWVIVDLTQDEIDANQAVHAQQVRQERNDKLTASDWTQVADAPVDKAAWATYRQALRDISSQAGFPWNVSWPDDPFKKSAN